MLWAIHHWAVVSCHWQCKYHSWRDSQRSVIDGSTYPPQHHWLRLQSKAFPKWTKLPSVPPAFHWLCIGRMKYACIVYLRKKKSISFIHLWIDWYNGIADFDLPSLWHSQYLYSYVSCFTRRILGTVNQDFHFQQMVPDPKLYVYAVLYDSDVMSVTNVFGQCLIMHGSVQSAEFQVCFLTIVLWLVYLFWGGSSYWCGEPQLTPQPALRSVPMWYCVFSDFSVTVVLCSTVASA